MHIGWQYKTEFIDMELANEKNGGMVENSNYKTLMNEWGV